MMALANGFLRLALILFIASLAASCAKPVERNIWRDMMKDGTL